MHHGLIPQGELAPLQAALQAREEQHPLMSPLAHGGSEEAISALALLFGPVHGEVGVPEQGLAVVSVLGIDRDAHAGAQGHLAIGHGARSGDLVEDGLGGHGCVISPLEVLEEHRELVAPDAGDAVGAARRVADALGHRAQDLVAGLVAQVVVDRLEPVEIDEDEPHPALPPSGSQQHLVQGLEKEGAIRKAGEAVVAGQALQLGLRLPQVEEPPVEIAIEPLELFLGRPLVGNVDEDPVPHGRPIALAPRDRFATDPHGAQGGVDVKDLVPGGEIAGRDLDGPHDALAVLGAHECPGVDPARLNVFGGETEQLPHAAAHEREALLAVWSEAKLVDRTRDGLGDAGDPGLALAQVLKHARFFGLQGLPLGEVAQEGGEDHAALHVGGKDRHLHGDLGPVRAHGRGLEPAAQLAMVLARLHERTQAPTQLLAKRRRHDLLDHLAAHHLVARIAEQPARRGVELEDLALVVEGDDGVEGGVENRGLAKLARPQLLFPLAPVREALYGQGEAKGRGGSRTSGRPRRLHEFGHAAASVAPIDQELHPAAVKPRLARGLARHLAHHPHLLGVAGQVKGEAELGPELEGPRRLEEHPPRPDVHHRALELLLLVDEARPVFELHRDPLVATGGHGQKLVEAPVPEEGIEGEGKDGVGPRRQQGLCALGAEAPVENRDGGRTGARVGAQRAHERLDLGKDGQRDEDQAGRAGAGGQEGLLRGLDPHPLEAPTPQARAPQLWLGIGGRDDQDLGQADLRLDRFEVGEPLEEPEALVDLRALQGEQPVEAEGLHAEGGEGASHDHGSAQGVFLEVLAPREVAQEPSGEGVAGPRGVEHVFQRIRRGGEAAMVGEHQDAVLALLDHQGPRSQSPNGPRRLHDVPLARELARLGVVDEQHIYLGQGFLELAKLARDPEVHGVAGHETRPLHLPKHLVLQDGVDVPEEHVARVLVGGGDLGLEELEDVEIGTNGVAGVEVVGVLPLPVESEAVRPLEAGGVDGAAREGGELLLSEIAPHHPHQVHGAEERGGHREEGGAASEHPLGLAERRLHRVVRDAAHDEDGHYRMYLPMMGARSRFVCSGTSSAGVMRACFRAFAHSQPRGPA